MERDTVWYELLEAMQHSDSCPVCALTMEKLKRRIDAFLYECVNDVRLRRQINASHGFCGHHAFMLMNAGDPVAHAVLYGTFLDAECTELAKTPPVAAKHAKSAGLGGGCMFCDFVAECEQSYAGAFGRFFSDPEFSGVYRQSGILCVPHLHTAQAAMKDLEAIAQLRGSTEGKYAKIAADLSEIRRKSDYRYSSEKWTASERTAWKKAVQIMNGFEGCKSAETL